MIRKLKNKFILVITIVISLNLMGMNSAKAEGIPPKVKAFLIVCGYGTVGGALLGVATLAFDANPRSVAQGASLGLYAGIIFGAYVISSHKTAASDIAPVEQYNPGYPPPADPYAPGGGYGAPPADESTEPRGLFDFRFEEQRIDLAIYNGDAQINRTPPVYMNLYQTNF
jgi:hypothetical protein